MKGLFVGDVHAKADELDDCRALIELVKRTALEHNPDYICFLGDQYHTHAVVNVEVQAFWIWAYKELSAFKVFALVGNHDKPGNRSSKAHAMQVHSDQIEVVEHPTIYFDTLFVPFVHDTKEFLEIAKKYNGYDVLVCHQTFTGVKEGAFYAKEAVELDDIPQRSVVSGHIHTPMKMGKCIYPGAPRAMTIADANVERSLRLITFTDGFVTENVSIPTGPCVKQIWQLTETPNEEVPVETLLEGKANARDHVVVNLQGPRAWAELRKAELSKYRAGIRFRLFATDAKQSSVKESDGIQVAFSKHLAAYKPKHSTTRDVLEKMVQERVQLV